MIVTGPASRSNSAKGIKGVAVQTDHGLIVDRCRFAAMIEFAERAAVLEQSAEIQIAFGAHEVSTVTGTVLPPCSCAVAAVTAKTTAPLRKEFVWCS